MKKRKSLKFNSVKYLSNYLGYPDSFLKSIQLEFDDHYRVDSERTINGKKRIIVYPDVTLKSVLRQIDRKIMDRLIYPSSYQGGVKGGSILTNAQLHLRQPTVLKIDIKSFFPSVSSDNVKRAFQRRGFSKNASAFMASITTVNNPFDHLPQGFPTSPKIALLSLEPFERRLYLLAKKFDWKYSFWIDDITISANVPLNRFINTIKRMLLEEGFRINDDKFKRYGFATGRSKKMVTGLIVNKKINVPKEYTRSLRKAIYICGKFGPQRLLFDKCFPQTSNIKKLHDTLLGKINYVKSINHSVGNKLMSDFNKINFNTP